MVTLRKSAGVEIWEMRELVNRRSFSECEENPATRASISDGKSSNCSITNSILQLGILLEYPVANCVSVAHLQYYRQWNLRLQRSSYRARGLGSAPNSTTSGLHQQFCVGSTLQSGPWEAWMPSLNQAALFISALTPVRCLHDYKNDREYTYLFQTRLSMLLRYSSPKSHRFKLFLGCQRQIHRIFEGLLHTLAVQCLRKRN